MSGSQEPPPTTSGALADMDPDSPLAEELRELVRSHSGLQLKLHNLHKPCQ